MVGGPRARNQGGEGSVGCPKVLRVLVVESFNMSNIESLSCSHCEGKFFFDRGDVPLKF